MTDYFLNVPSQKFPVPKITKQTKSHSLNFNVLSSVIDSSGEEVWVSFDSDNYALTFLMKDLCVPRISQKTWRTWVLKLKPIELPHVL